MRTSSLSSLMCVCSLLSPLRQMCNFPVSVFYSLFNSPSPTQDIGSMGTFTPHRHSHPPPHPKKSTTPADESHDTIRPLHPHWASVSVTRQQLNICPRIINQYEDSALQNMMVWIFFWWMLAERIGCELTKANKVPYRLPITQLTNSELEPD